MSHGLTLHELRQDSGVPRGGAGAQGTPVSPIMQQEQAEGVQAQGTFSGERLGASAVLSLATIGQHRAHAWQ